MKQTFTIFGTPEAKRPRVGTEGIDQSPDKSSKLSSNAAKVNYTFSFILIEIANNCISTLLTNLKTPLDFKRENLKKTIAVYDAAIAGGKLEAEFIEEANISKQDLKEQLLKVQNLINQKSELDAVLTGALPFAQRSLSPTFIYQYKQCFGDKYRTEEDVRKHLSVMLKNISEGNNKVNVLEQHVKFFEIKGQVTKSLQEYLASTRNSLKRQIELKIGSVATEVEKKQYRELYNLSEVETTQETCNRVTGYIQSNKDKICLTMKGIAACMQDNDYLKYIESCSFLSQVILYRQIARDLQKTALVTGEEYEEQKNIPPGLNLTVKFTSGGCSSMLVGDMGAYSNMPSKFLVTLMNYRSFMTKEVEAQEKEYSFKVLHQIESMRSTSALITIPMFFELAENHYQSVRNGSEEYSWNKIHEQLPMAMQKSVPSATFIENAVGKFLTVSFPYDYRDVSSDHDSAEILEQKNKNIVTDYILYKAQVAEQDITDVDSENSFVKNGCTFSIDSSKNPVKVKDIKSFPLKILTDVMQHWYCEQELDFQLIHDNIIVTLTGSDSYSN